MRSHSLALVGLTTGAFLLASCATKPEEIEPIYVSPAAYQNMSCSALAAEAQRVAAEAARLTGQQQETYRRDAAAMTVAWVIAWPALFFIRGDENTALALGQIRGQMVAIEDV